jgi:hypothetical protein
MLIEQSNKKESNTVRRHTLSMRIAVLVECGERQRTQGFCSPIKTSLPLPNLLTREPCNEGVEPSANNKVKIKSCATFLVLLLA